MVSGNRSPDPETNRRIDEIKQVGYMCSSTMNGKWELEHLPYEGGYYEQPALVMEDIHLKIGCFNQAVEEDSDD